LALCGDYFRNLISGQRGGLWPALQRGGLRLASLPYALAMGLRNRLYDGGWKRIYQAAVPVVSIGNLTLGGTGKTPCVEYVARFYQQQGVRLAILSRGYGTRAGRNDEALVLEENLPDVPHLQGADRVALARTAVNELKSEVLVLDDGFQHRRLKRDFDLVLVDATNPWGYGSLFPRGLLREPIGSLRRADMILLTRCDQVNEETCLRIQKEIARSAPDVPVGRTWHQPVELRNSERKTAPLPVLKTQPVAAFCGIGNPNGFRRTLADLETQICAFRSFPDHHAYTRADVAELRGWAEKQAKECLLVTTQKDLVKLGRTELGGRALWALRIRLHVEAGQETLQQKLLSVIRPARPSGGQG
jgi:tetraacyldisaccharide 4'-kinase